MLGTLIENALWYNCMVPTEYHDAKRGIEDAFNQAADLYGVVFGPVAWEDVAPDSPRVVHPPEHMKGTVRCLIGSAKVVGKQWGFTESEFIDTLSEKEKAELRQATRRAFMKAGGLTLEDDEVDYIINQHGPGIVEAEVFQN